MNTCNPKTILNFCLLVTFLSPLSGCSTFTKSTASVTYTNPVYAANLPDPSVKKIGKYYYAFGTTAGGRLPDGRIFTVLRSRNLAQWEPLGGALVPPSSNTNYQYWAPEIAENDGSITCIMPWVAWNRSILSFEWA